jgi:type II secretory pathway component PulM
MQQGWGDRIVLALSGITLILVVVYLVLIEQNRAIQAEANQRQQFINQSLQFSRVNDALVHALAAAAVNGKDDKLRALLAQNGIAIDPKTGAPVPAAAPGTAPPGAASTPLPPLGNGK